MGGGNAQKSATARARNQEKAAKAKGGKSQLKSNAQAQNIICNVCKSTFLCTATRAKLQEHVGAKHEGKATFEACFPNFEKA